MKVYVVISDYIVNHNQSHGMHGVYASKDSARNTAISIITSMASKHKVIIGPCDIHCDDDALEFHCIKKDFSIYVSCFEEDVQ